MTTNRAFTFKVEFNNEYNYSEQTYWYVPTIGCYVSTKLREPDSYGSWHLTEMITEKEYIEKMTEHSIAEVKIGYWNDLQKHVD